MKRLFLAILLIACLVGETAVQADDSPAVLAAETIGAGWMLVEHAEPGNSLSTWKKLTRYDHPDGSVVAIWLIELGDSIGALESNWGAARLFYGATAEREAVVPDPLSEGISAADVALPDGVSDGIRIEGLGRTNQDTTGAGLFGSLEHRVAIVVLTEGTVNDLTGVAAADYIAGLYFAALSDQ
jgi:hypothetical protein